MKVDLHERAPLEDVGNALDCRSFDQRIRNDVKVTVKSFSQPPCLLRSHVNREIDAQSRAWLPVHHASQGSTEQIRNVKALKMLRNFNGYEERIDDVGHQRGNVSPESCKTTSGPYFCMAARRSSSASSAPG